MAGVESAQIRNVVLMSHGGAGKTSLVEALAFSAGAISRQGRIEDGNTLADYDEDERRRGMSVNTALASFPHGGAQINLVDTPGYADFIGDMIAGASAADIAMVLVDAASGVQVGTETAWRLAGQRKMPRVVVVSRLDRENASWDESLASIQAVLGPQCQPLQLPIGQEATLKGVVDVLSGKAYMGNQSKGREAPTEMADALAAARDAVVERIAESDDELTLKFLEGEELTQEEIANGLTGAIAAGTFVPILASAAVKNIGVQPTLDLIVNEFPDATAVGMRPVLINNETGELACDAAGPAAALVFKTLADDFVGRLSYFRVVSGTIASDGHLTNMQKGDDERPANLSRVLGKELIRVDKLVAGEIGAVTKLSETTTFDTLAAADSGIVIPAPTLPSSRPRSSRKQRPMSTSWDRDCNTWSRRTQHCQCGAMPTRRRRC